MQKQINYTKIIFLREFTKELILSSFREQQTKQKIQIEKIRQRFVQPSVSSKENYQVSVSNISQKTKPLKPLIYRKSMIPIQPVNRITNPSEPLFKKSIQEVVAVQKQKLAEIKPEPQPKPIGFNLGKLEPLAQDNSIHLIECSGPGKNILIRRYNQPNVTKITLNQAEITDIINNFSIEARIPVVGGILKAAVGNLIISAVISDFVGSRFIINKINPFSMLMEQ
jgi:hypothetical protein